MTNKSGIKAENFEEALSAALARLGERKAVATDLWPLKTLRDAHNRLDACLNPEKADKFATEEIIYLLRRLREVDCHAAINWLCETCGYEAPKPQVAADEKSKLMREYIDAVKLQALIAEKWGILDKLPESMRPA